MQTSEARSAGESSGPMPGFVGQFVRTWPWIASIVAAVVVDLVVGAVRSFDFAGIQGFSTLNYGWLAFTLVGGAGMAWRLARRPGSWWIVLRVFVAPITAFVLCFILVTLTGLAFLPGQPILETVTTDSPGRAFWLAVLVVLIAAVCESVFALGRAVRRRVRAT
jgi:hypothetical protein